MIHQPVKKIVFLKVPHSINRHHVIEIDTNRYIQIIAKAFVLALSGRLPNPKAIHWIMDGDLLSNGRIIATVRIKPQTPNKNEPQPITSNELQLPNIASSLSGKSVRKGIAKKENSFRYDRAWWKGLLAAISRTLGLAAKHHKRQNE
jgi:hypothetical protein